MRGRICNKCLILKSVNEYYVRTSGKLYTRCKGCIGDWLKHRDRINRYSYKTNRTIKGRYRQSLYQAQKRGLVWELDVFLFECLTKQNCDYCGKATGVTGSGIDRKDNMQGYVIGNVVPCCKACNRIKNEYLTYDEMKYVMNRLTIYRKNRLCKIA